MNGVFSPISISAVVACCMFLQTSQAPAEGPLSESFDCFSADSDNHCPGVEASTPSFLVFEFLDYVTLSPQAAFSDHSSSGQIITCRGVAESSISHDETEQRQLFRSASQSPRESESAVYELNTEHETADKLPSPASRSNDQSTENPRSFVARPLSEIRLDEANRPVSQKGEPLKTPAVESRQAGIPVEEHYTPAPWQRCHPPRNTFPFRHQPLYFEDPNMERCGQSAGCLTEAVNIAHFAGRIPIVPYMMAAHPPDQLVRALPDCPTCHSFGTDAYVPEPTLHTITVEAVAATGLIFLIP